jgi:membrane associated rhomboid family serine protease
MSIFDSTWKDARHAFTSGNMVTKLMLVNTAVFVVMMIVWIGIRMTNPDQFVAQSRFEWFYHLFCTPSDLGTLIWQPWSLFTSMFLHVDFWGHLLSNLIFMGLFGRVVGDLIGDRRVLPIYLAGALIGDLFYILQSNIVTPGVDHYALGASGGVMAFAGAALLLAPDYEYFFLILGRVKLKYVVGLLVLLDLVGIADDINTGGHIAHLGGFALGCFFVMRLREGKDLSEPINRILERISSFFSWRQRPQVTTRRKAVRVTMSPPAHTKGHAASDTHDPSFQEKLDTILDKIKMQGYEGLTQEEKNFLYEASKK